MSAVEKVTPLMNGTIIICKKIINNTINIITQRNVINIINNLSIYLPAKNRIRSHLVLHGKSVLQQIPTVTVTQETHEPFLRPVQPRIPRSYRVKNPADLGRQSDQEHIFLGSIEERREYRGFVFCLHEQRNYYPERPQGFE